MIFSFFSFLLLFFAKIYSFLPSWDIPQNWIATIQIIVGYMKMFDGIVPINDLLVMVLLITIFEIVVYIAKIIVSIFNWVRGSGSIDIGF